MAATSSYPYGDDWFGSQQNSNSSTPNMIVEDSSSTFINPSQVFHHAGHEASSSRPGLQRHLSLNLAGSSAFDPPPSLSPMNLQDSSYSQAAFPASPALPQTATSIMTSSSATARPSRHKAKRSLSAGDLSQVFASARADFHHPMPAAPRPQTNNASFISKLWNMLSQTDEEHATLISFSSNGSTFVIANATEFAKTILPQHFKHNNFSSFVRQLNMYGFSKLNKTARGMRGAPEAQVWEFSHPKFHRDRPDLLETIRRKTMDDSTTSTIAIPLSPANTRLHQTRSASAEAARGDRSPSYTSPSDANTTPATSLQTSGDMPIAPHPGTSTSPLSTPVTPASNTSPHVPTFHASPEVHSRSAPIPHAETFDGQQHTDAGQYIASLQTTCRSLRDTVEDQRRKQGCLIDIVGQLYNYLQQSSSGQLPFDFPALLQEEAFASAASRVDMPPIMIDAPRATLTNPQGQQTAQMRWSASHSMPYSAGFAQPQVSPVITTSLPASPMPPQTQSFGDVPQGTLAGLGIPLDGKYDGTSSSDLSSGGESDFSETMMH